MLEAEEVVAGAAAEERIAAAAGRDGTAVRAEACAELGSAEVVLRDIGLAEPELEFEPRYPPDSSSSYLAQPPSQY